MTDLTPTLQHLARLRQQRDEAVEKFEREPSDVHGGEMAFVIEAERFIELQVKGSIMDYLPPELWDVVTFQIGDLSKFLAIPAESDSLNQSHPLA